MAEIYDLDTSAANNNSSPPDGFPENMQYSEVNDSAREFMAIIARYIEAQSAITTTGTGNAYILTINQTITALQKGMSFVFQADKTNTGVVTLQINSLAAASVVDSFGNALVGGDLALNGIYLAFYNGSAFQLASSGATFTAIERVKLGGIESGATADQSASQIKTAYESNSNTNAFTDTLLSKINGIESGATADQSASQIKTAYESNSNTNAFTDTLLSKINGIESGATADQSASQIKTSYESNSNTNAFTDAEQSKLASTQVFTSANQTKLNGIESGATADQSASQIKTAYESNSNTNAFTDTLLSKLNGIESGATADQSASQIKTSYESNSNTNAFTDAQVTKLAGIEEGATAGGGGGSNTAIVRKNGSTSAFGSLVVDTDLVLVAPTSGTIFAITYFLNVSLGSSSSAGFRFEMQSTSSINQPSRIAFRSHANSRTTGTSPYTGVLTSGPIYEMDTTDAPQGTDFIVIEAMVTLNSAGTPTINLAYDRNESAGLISVNAGSYAQIIVGG